MSRHGMVKRNSGDYLINTYNLMVEFGIVLKSTGLRLIFLGLLEKGRCSLGGGFVTL